MGRAESSWRRPRAHSRRLPRSIESGARPRDGAAASASTGVRVDARERVEDRGRSQPATPLKEPAGPLWQ
jgi:hypothetical protein